MSKVRAMPEFTWLKCLKDEQGKGYAQIHKQNSQVEMPERLAEWERAGPYNINN
jgi:hypothetical protein